jgi:hypothetical protein
MTGDEKKAGDWKPRQKSPALRFKGVLRVITVTILVLALAGSMESVIKQTNGNWSDAINYIFTQSTLLQAVTWLGGLLLAFATVRSAQALTQYVSQKVIEITTILASNVDDKAARITQEAGFAAAMYLWGRFQDAQRQSRRAQVPVTSAANMPLAGVGGSILLPVTKPETDEGDEHAPEQDKPLDTIADKTPAKMSKIDRAIDMLKSDRTLRKLSTRDLEERYPDIKRNTWGTAKQRLGLK